MNTNTTANTYTVAADAAVRRSPTQTGSPGSAQVVRPPTVPPYYLGRPAHVWLAAFRYRGSRLAENA